MGWMRLLLSNQNSSRTRPLWQTLTNWGIILSGLLLYNGFNAFALIVIAPRVSQIAYGQYLACFSLTSFLVVLPGFGLDAWLLTQTPPSAAAATALWYSAIRSRVGLLMAWAVGMVFLGFILPQETYPAVLLWPTILGVALDQMLLITFAALRLQGRHQAVTIWQTCSAAVLLGLAWGVPVGEGHIAWFAWGRTLLSLGVMGLIGGQLGRQFRREPQPITPSREILQASRAFMVAELATVVYIRADLTLVSLLLGSLATSLYGPAINLLQATFLAPRALFFFVVPALSRLYTTRPTLFRLRSGQQFVAQIAVGLVITPVLFFLGPALITWLYQEQYAAAGDILRWLSPIPLLRASNFALGAILASAQKQPARTKVQVAAAIFAVVANVIVIRPYGLPGVAAVYVGSETILALGYLFLCWPIWRSHSPVAGH